jgi:glycosyltransferase involved in cell wall biosynthesis
MIRESGPARRNTNLMKLNWFSPLPPAPTDIAHYTKRILPALSSVAEVTLWTDQRDWHRQLEKFADVRTYRLERMPWAELNRADVTFYQMGNNPRFHGTIWQVSRLHAGVVVLHDFRLHHLFDGLYRVEFRDRDSYLEVMQRYYGEQGRRDAGYCYQTDARNIDYMAERYPLTNFALENAIGVVAHTRDSFDSLSKDQPWPIAYAPLPFPLNGVETPTTQRREKALDARYRLILFGYIGRNRRLNSIFKALAEIPERDSFQLEVFGSILDEEKQIRAEIKSLNLKNNVTLHGFTPEEELDRALSESDLAINLRFPTMGEASGSQLRIWAHALPSLVSPVGWYASISPEIAAFVRPDENEVADIQKHLRSFLANPQRFATMGERGRKELAENHSPEGYVRALLQIATRARNYRPRAAYLALAERAAASVGDWLGPQLAEETFRRVAGEVYVMAGEVKDANCY